MADYRAVFNVIGHRDYAKAASVQLSIEDTGGAFITGITFSAGDIKILRHTGGAWDVSNITTLPTEISTTGIYFLSLSATECTPDDTLYPIVIKIVKSSGDTVKGHTSLYFKPITGNLKQIDENATNDNLADLKLKSLEIDNSGTGIGMKVVGKGTGMLIKGEDVGSGINSETFGLRIQSSVGSSEFGKVAALHLDSENNNGSEDSTGDVIGLGILVTNNGHRCNIFGVKKDVRNNGTCDEEDDYMACDYSVSRNNGHINQRITLNNLEAYGHSESAIVKEDFIDSAGVINGKFGYLKMSGTNVGSADNSPLIDIQSPENLGTGINSNLIQFSSTESNMAALAFSSSSSGKDIKCKEIGNPISLDGGAASLSGMVNAVSNIVTQNGTLARFIKKILCNKMRLNTPSLDYITFYDDDNTTPIAICHLLNDSIKGRDKIL